LFAAPPERDLEWSDKGVEGCYRFLQRLWRLTAEYAARRPADSGAAAGGSAGDNTGGDTGVGDAGVGDAGAAAMRRQTHAIRKKVTRDLSERFNFNTAISAVMELVNALYLYKETAGASDAAAREGLESALLLLAPFAPHITEELWQALGHAGSIHAEPWPEVDEAALRSETATIVIQVNGKVKDRLEVPVGAGREETETLAAARAEKYIRGAVIRKVVAVPGKLVNFVVG
jgi:leucyl-tRNA synthetase